jgi:hypothetical protein
MSQDIDSVEMLKVIILKANYCSVLKIDVGIVTDF